MSNQQRLQGQQWLQELAETMQGWQLLVASGDPLFSAALAWTFPGPVQRAASLQELEAVLTAAAAEARLFLVLTSDLPDAESDQALQRLTQLLPPERRRLLVVFSDGCEREQLQAALAAGVQGLCRAGGIGSGQVYGAMAAIANGGLWLDPLFLQRLHAHGHGQGQDSDGESGHAGSLAFLGDPEALTARERQLLRAVCEGYNSQEIAERLQISHHSVRRHLSQAYQRIGVRDRAQAIGWCIAHGLVTATDLQRIYRPSVPG